MGVELIETDGLDGVKFGRNRVLRGIGSVLFAGGIVQSIAVDAAHADTCGSASPCGPTPKCCCCGGCDGYDRATCSGSNQCWTVCVYVEGCCQTYRCCDWYNRAGEKCICKTYLGKAC